MSLTFVQEVQICRPVCNQNSFGQNGLILTLQLQRVSGLKESAEESLEGTLGFYSVIRQRKTQCKEDFGKTPKTLATAIKKLWLEAFRQNILTSAKARPFDVPRLRRRDEPKIERSYW